MVGFRVHGHIYNVVIIVATNRKDPRYQTEFDEEDISSTQRAFVSAFETVTGQTLAKCPPILYLPFAETELLKRVKAAEILADTPFKIKELTVQVHSPPDVLGFIQEKREEYPAKSFSLKYSVPTAQIKLFTKTCQRVCKQLQPRKLGMRFQLRRASATLTLSRSILLLQKSLGV